MFESSFKVGLVRRTEKNQINLGEQNSEMCPYLINPLGSQTMENLFKKSY